MFSDTYHGEFVMHVPAREFVLFMTNGDFAAGQRKVELVYTEVPVGKFSEGQETPVQ